MEHLLIQILPQLITDKPLTLDTLKVRLSRVGNAKFWNLKKSHKIIIEAVPFLDYQNNKGIQISDFQGALMFKSFQQPVIFLLENETV